MSTENKYQFKGTKGVWEISNHEYDNWIGSNNSNSLGGIVCRQPEEDDEHSCREWEYNKFIISAAPELLQACIEALWYEENGEAEAQRQGRLRLTERLELYRNAIHKALNIQD